MPNFRPDTGGRRWFLARVASSVALWGGTGTAFPVCAAFPVYVAQIPGCSIWIIPCAAPSSSPRCSTKKRGLGCACVLCLPRPEQLRQPGAGRAHSPRVRCAFSPPRTEPQFSNAGRVRLVSVLRSWPLATTLPADVGHPESQEVFG